MYTFWQPSVPGHHALCPASAIMTPQHMRVSSHQVVMSDKIAYLEIAQQKENVNHIAFSQISHASDFCNASTSVLRKCALRPCLSNASRLAVTSVQTFGVSPPRVETTKVAELLELRRATELVLCALTRRSESSQRRTSTPARRSPEAGTAQVRRRSADSRTM